jgi:hydrogenase maturation protease
MTEQDRAAPILVFGYGNPSRGDDALGPRLVARLATQRAAGRLPGIALLTDFQPQIEHVLDLRNRDRVIFVDAELGQQPAEPCPPWRWLPVEPKRDIGWTSHALSPNQLAGLFGRLYPDQHPVLEVLAIRGQDDRLGADLSDRARANLDSAVNALIEELGR